MMTSSSGNVRNKKYDDLDVGLGHGNFQFECYLRRDHLVQVWVVRATHLKARLVRLNYLSSWKYCAS